MSIESLVVFTVALRTSKLETNEARVSYFTKPCQSSGHSKWLEIV